MEVCIRRISMVVVAILDVKLEHCGLIQYNMYYPQIPSFIRWFGGDLLACRDPKFEGQTPRPNWVAWLM